MWVRVQRMRRATPRATQGWKRAAMRAAGVEPGSPICCMPLVRAEFPATLVRMVRTVKRRVLEWRDKALCQFNGGLNFSGRLRPNPGRKSRAGSGETEAEDEADD